MGNEKSDLYIKIIIFFYSLFVIVSSFAVINNLFFLYLEQTVRENERLILGEALNIGNIILACFAVYYSVKTMLVFEIEEKFRAQNQAACFLFVTYFFFVIINRFFLLCKGENTIEMYSCISLIVWLAITLFVACEKRVFLKERK